MDYLVLKGLHKSFARKTVFDGLDLTLSQGQKVALVAANGAGKSTLIHTILGDISCPEGSVRISDKISVGVLLQETHFPEESTVIDILFAGDTPREMIIKEYETVIAQPTLNQERYESIVTKINQLDAWGFEARVRTVISQLDLTHFLEQQVSTLSGGQRKRLALAKLLIDEPDFLILDEPTNHLDLTMIEWLEHYIKRNKLTLLMVTHDRYFLQRICTDIYELDRGKIVRFPGNYEFYLKKKSKMNAQEEKEVHQMKQHYKHELSWMKTDPRARETKSSKRQKDFYVMEKEFKQKRKLLKQRATGLELFVGERRLGGKVLVVQGMHKSFGERVLVKDFGYEFHQGERIGIIGPNGVGKSTFINMLMGIEPMDSGHLAQGKTVVFGHYSQQQASFPGGKRVLEVVTDVAEFIKLADGSRLSASKLLERFLFPPKQQHGFVRHLSGGEKRRLSLLMILLKSPNFLILDEPTNDLDIHTIQIVEEFLLSFKGCLIVISHDRFFMDKVVDHLFVFEGEGVITDVWGGYSSYKALLNTKEDDSGSDEEISEEEVEIERPGLSYHEKQEFADLGPLIEKLDIRKNEINDEFSKPDLPHKQLKKLSIEMAKLLEKIEEVETRWLSLLEKSK